MGQILGRDELALICDRLREEGRTIVTTNGCFDILHVGHLSVLTQSKDLGDVLVVGINSDDSVRRLKGPTRPINGDRDRAELLAALSCVDYVSIFPEDTPIELLRALRPNIHVKGGDYKKEDLAETPVVESAGGKLVIIDLVPGKSTTGVVERIQNDG